MRRHPQRGSALIVAVVVLLAITMIAVAMIRFTSRELAGATAAGKEQALVACAETARKLLMSKFHALGLPPADVAALNVSLDSRTKAVGGHYDTAGVSIAQVTYLPTNAFGPNTIVRDLTNVIGGGGAGVPRPMKIVVHCQQAGDGSATSGRQLEVEFGVRFGL